MPPMLHEALMSDGITDPFLSWRCSQSNRSWLKWCCNNVSGCALLMDGHTYRSPAKSADQVDGITDLKAPWA